MGKKKQRKGKHKSKTKVKVQKTEISKETVKIDEIPGQKSKENTEDEAELKEQNNIKQNSNSELSGEQDNQAKEQGTQTVEEKQDKLSVEGAESEPAGEQVEPNKEQDTHSNQAPIEESVDGPKDQVEKKQDKENKITDEDKSLITATEQITNSDPKQGVFNISRKKILGIAAGIVLFILIGVYLGGMIYFQNRFFKDTTINDMDVSYNTVDEIEEVIAKQISEYEIVLQMRDGQEEKIYGVQIDYHYKSNNDVKNFKKQQSAYKWPLSLFKSYQYSFTMESVYDEELLQGNVDQLECFSKEVEIEPSDAFLDFQNNLFVVAEEDEGLKVNKTRLLESLRGFLEAGKSVLNLEKQNCYEEPQVRADDYMLNLLVANLNAYAKTSITYIFGETKEVLDGNTIKDWLSYDEEGNVTLDEEQIPLYVAELAEKYDTYNTARHFKTHDGSYVDVTGGSYGWKIDQESEAAELLELVKVGAERERTATFAQTAVSWENSDLGSDYVEIDLTNQRLWMYIDGEEVIASDIVSGDLSRSSRTTPSGTFTLYYKTSPAVLKSTTPGDSYETPVTYWMPFNGGIGLHDASWRGSFGGTIYKYNGSHGCINLPSSVAKEIYQLIYKGIPIICYYR